MLANHKVSVPWQKVATFVPIANFWAFYRIKKLRKYVWFVAIPQSVLWGIIMWYGYMGAYSFMGMNPLNPLVGLLAMVAALAIQGFAIYLIIIWSRQYNRSFDTPPAQG